MRDRDLVLLKIVQSSLTQSVDFRIFGPEMFFVLGPLTYCACRTAHSFWGTIYLEVMLDKFCR